MKRHIESVSSSGRKGIKPTGKVNFILPQLQSKQTTRHEFTLLRNPITIIQDVTNDLAQILRCDCCSVSETLATPGLKRPSHHNPTSIGEPSPLANRHRLFPTSIGVPTSIGQGTSISVPSCIPDVQGLILPEVATSTTGDFFMWSDLGDYVVVPYGLFSHPVLRRRWLAVRTLSPFGHCIISNLVNLKSEYQFPFAPIAIDIRFNAPWESLFAWCSRCLKPVLKVIPP
ncbi:hypothetical protein BD410DRAFT_158513 [Rickenella mellea]|uniref:Uncharacterized protein n=1 Tax=Rickenella mellea TaxID=50990 RepID=A0A4Y7Q6X8_9AGAM|nr:hypothetical protein BD410DRAFT_158513 [Rickenella mellea]